RRILRLRIFVSKPPFPFLIFLLAVGVWTAVGFIFSPWMLNQAYLGGVTYYYYSYQICYIATSALLLVCFVSMPVLSFFHQSKTVQAKEASLSMKITSLSWPCFGVLPLIQPAAGWL